jgi:hypothetical protein
MMSHKITIMALMLIAGIVLGAGATEGLNAYRQSRDSQIFQQRFRCRAAADAYVKEKSTDSNEDPFSGVTVTLDKVDYSPARNSCVAEVETAYVFKGGALVSESLRDLLSGETLFSVKCPDYDCEAPWSSFVNSAFDHVMNNASQLHDSYLHELEMKAADIQAKYPPKSASHSGPQGVPAGVTLSPIEHTPQVGTPPGR